MGAVHRGPVSALSRRHHSIPNDILPCRPSWCAVSFLLLLVFGSFGLLLAKRVLTVYSGLFCRKFHVSTTEPHESAPSCTSRDIKTSLNPRTWSCRRLPNPNLSNHYRRTSFQRQHDPSVRKRPGLPFLRAFGQTLNIRPKGASIIPRRLERRGSL